LFKYKELNNVETAVSNLLIISYFFGEEGNKVKNQTYIFSTKVKKTLFFPIKP